MQWDCQPDCGKAELFGVPHALRVRCMCAHLTGVNLAVSAAVLLWRGTSSLPAANFNVGASRLAFTMGTHLSTSLRVSSYLGAAARHRSD